MSARSTSRLLVFAAPLAALAPVLTSGFAGWDEPAFIVENPAIRGLGVDHLRAMAASTLGGVWTPLTWLSLALDRAVWGLEPGGYHLTSLLLHAAGALILLEIGRALLKDERAAVLAALLWAVHPLRVETVAWAAERKGVLAGVLVLASLLARLKGRGGAALGLYALALAAKPNVLTYPGALLALESLWLKRRPDWRGLAPYAALSTAAFAATRLAMAQAGFEASPPGSAWAAGQAAYGLAFYPLKTLWPFGLSIYYPPLPWFGTWSWPLAAWAAIAVAAAVASRRRAGAAAAVACYALLLLPMLGFMRHGVPYSAADRFSYLPAVALALPLGAILARSAAGTVFAAAWIVALGVLTWRQCAAWNDPVAAWAAAARNRPSALAEGNLGALLVREGRLEEGLALLRSSIERDPASPVPREALGAALARAGRVDEARVAWREALSAAPSPETKALLGVSLGGADGVRLLREAVAQRPERAGWRADLAAALSASGDAAAARRELETALAADPSLGRARVQLGLLLERAGRADEAVSQYKAALKDENSRAAAQHDWADVLMARGRTGEAERRYREAIRIEPGLGAAQINLGNILARRGDLAGAAARYRAALAADPKSVEARANLGAVTR